jgi:hypothetical protein
LTLRAPVKVASQAAVVGQEKVALKYLMPFLDEIKSVSEGWKHHRTGKLN